MHPVHAGDKAPARPWAILPTASVTKLGLFWIFMTVKPILMIAGIVLLGSPLQLAAETQFCHAWSFFKGDAGTAADTSSWETVDLPHTWNVSDASDGGGKDNQSRDGYYRGPGWYRKSIKADESLRGKRLSRSDSCVWELKGTAPGGSR
jgi:hypothetical protein